jgi:hypothetical protein
MTEPTTPTIYRRTYSVLSIAQRHPKLFAALVRNSQPLKRS